jgi:hypothetical protein
LPGRAHCPRPAGTRCPFKASRGSTSRCTGGTSRSLVDRGCYDFGTRSRALSRKNRERPSEIRFFRKSFRNT